MNKRYIRAIWYSVFQYLDEYLRDDSRQCQPIHFPRAIVQKRTIRFRHPIVATNLSLWSSMALDTSQEFEEGTW